MELPEIIEDFHEWADYSGTSDAMLTDPWNVLRFRGRLLDEELSETLTAIQNRDPEELVDGLVDIMVVAGATLAALGVNVDKAWKEVHKANMAKQPGVKPGRDSDGAPDMMKPDDWVSPNHNGNHGVLNEQ